MNTLQNHGQQLGEKGTQHQLLSTVLRQFSLPNLSRGLAEVAMFAGVFIAASKISLGMPYDQMFVPMVTMIASGVFRKDITDCIVNLYLHSAYGFALAAVLLLPTIVFFLPQLLDPRFIFFFLFFAFFVTGALRPLISGTDFMDGGGRRVN